MSSGQRLISNLDNRLADATITADDVQPAEHAAFPEALERNGFGDVQITGAFTGAEDAALEIEVTSDTAGDDRRTTEPEFTGVGNGTLEGLSATTAASQAYTVSLIDTGTDTVPAEFPIEGVKLVAATSGITGNLLALQVNASAITYTPTGATTVEEASAGSDSFSSDAWSLGGFPLVNGRLDANTPRVAFGDDPTIYRPYRERRDGRWIYRVTPALQNDVPKGAAIQVVTGSRGVTLTDGSDSEVYNGVVTAWDLLGQIQASSDLAVIDGTASNDRTPGGMASRELSLITDAKITRVEGVGTRYVTDLEGLAATEDAKSQTVTVECTAANSVGRERWAVVGSADGDLGTATTAQAFESDVLDFTIPKQIPLGGEGLRFEHVATRYVAEDVNDRAPICLDQMHTGTNATSRTMTLTYRQRPGAGCECEDTAYTGSVSPEILGVDSLADDGNAGSGSSSFNREPYDAEYQAIVDQLTGADQSGVAGFSGNGYRAQLDQIGTDLLDGEPGGRTYYVQHKAIADTGATAYADGHYFGEDMRATLDGSYLLVKRNGTFRLLNGSGSSYSEVSQMPTVFASYTFKQIVNQRQPLLCKDGDRIRLYVLFKDNASPANSALDRLGVIDYDTVSEAWSETVHSSARNWPGFTDASGDFAYTVDDARTTLLVLNADDGTTYASLDMTTLVTWAGGETAYLPDDLMSVSSDGAYICLVSRVSGSVYIGRIFNLSGTTLTEQEDRGIGIPYYGTSLSSDGSRAWITNVGVLERSGSTWSDYDTQLGIRDDGWRISPDGMVLLRTEGSGPFAVRQDDATEFVQTDGDSGLARAMEYAWVADSTTLLRADPTSDDVTVGTNSGEIQVHALSGGVYTAGTPIQPEDDGSAGLCAVLEGGHDSASPYTQGYIAEFSSESDAEEWRSRYASRLDVVEVAGQWRARITLNSEFADSLDRTSEGDLSAGQVLYAGTESGGLYTITDYGSEASASAAISEIYGEPVLLPAGSSPAASAPVIDETIEYAPFTEYRAELAALYTATYEAHDSSAVQVDFVAWFDAFEADKAQVISGELDGNEPAIRDRYDTERDAYTAAYASYDPDRYDDYLAALNGVRSELATLSEYPSLIADFDAWWAVVTADADDVASGALDGGEPAIADRYVTEKTAYETAKQDATLVWQDTGANYWWVFSVDSNDVGYLPAFTNVVYHSAANKNGSPYSTKEFAFVIKVGCPSKLQDGDQIILNLDTGDAAYVVGDRWEIDIIAGASGDFYGGVDGDNTLTWDIRGSSSGALGTYSVEDGSEAAYSSNGLNFTIYRGTIPFAAGDRFTFSVEGGAWRWRFDDEDWTTVEGFPSGATALYRGLSATWVQGRSPSFVSGDLWRWAVEQPAAPSHVADSFGEPWTFAAADTVWSATWGAAVDVAVVLIARHSLPAGSTVTVVGSAGEVQQFSETLTVGSGGLVLVLDDTAAIDRLELTPSAEGGSIGWVFAGDPPGIGGDAAVSMRPAWAMIRSGLTGAIARGRRDHAELRWDYLTADDVTQLIAMFDHSKSAGDAPLAYIPSILSDTPKARLVTFADDELALPDLYGWTDDDPVVYDVVAALQGILL